jgi:hypothetical protein
VSAAVNPWVTREKLCGAGPLCKRHINTLVVKMDSGTQVTGDLIYRELVEQLKNIHSPRSEQSDNRERN